MNVYMQKNKKKANKNGSERRKQQQKNPSPFNAIRSFPTLGRAKRYDEDKRIKIHNMFDYSALLWKNKPHLHQR